MSETLGTRRRARLPTAMAVAATSTGLGEQHQCRRRRCTACRDQDSTQSRKASEHVFKRRFDVKEMSSNGRVDTDSFSRSSSSRRRTRVAAVGAAKAGEDERNSIERGIAGEHPGSCSSSRNGIITRTSGCGGSGRTVMASLILAVAVICPTSSYGFLVPAAGCDHMCGLGSFNQQQQQQRQQWYASDDVSPHCPPWSSGGRAVEGTILRGQSEGRGATGGAFLGGGGAEAGNDSLLGGRRRRRRGTPPSLSLGNMTRETLQGSRGRFGGGSTGADGGRRAEAVGALSSSQGSFQGSFQGPYHAHDDGGNGRKGAMGVVMAMMGAGSGGHDEPRRSEGHKLDSSRHGGGEKHGSPAETGVGGGGDTGRKAGGTRAAVGGGDPEDDGSSPSPFRNSPLRWMRRNLRAGWASRAGVSGRGSLRNGGARGRVSATKMDSPESGQAATMERRDEEALGLGAPGVEGGEGEGEQEPGFRHHGMGLRGWGLSGWASDIDDRRMGWSNKEWKKFTGGLRQPWTARGVGGMGVGGDKQTWPSWNSIFKLDTSGVQEMLKAKGGDLAIRTLAKLQTMAGQEDEAEETLLKLIRDPYNLADASWGPGSAAETAEWRRLEVHQKRIKQKHLKDVMSLENRSLALSAEFEGTILDYSRMNVSQLTMKLLLDLAKRQDLKEKISAMFRGDKINNTEDRAVLHVALRSHRDDPPIMVDGVNVIQQVHDTLNKVRDFSERVRSGELRGATGKNLINIVAVGIGGSYLGPEFVHEAFKTQEYAEREKAENYRLRFLSNVDPVDVRRTLYDLDPEETLVVVISKTFTTAETMLNARTARQWLWDTMGNNPEVAMKHMAGCASESAAERVIAFGIPEERLFPLWDWVGGRYSVCSSVGALPLSLKYGFQQFDSFLAGARSMDKHFLFAPFERNMPVLMGLLGVWNISFMGYKTRTILPYAEALLKFPAHIQQLAMESNGKRVTRNGKLVAYNIGQVDFGEPGTNGQHSFFQLLHMGQICPAEFIGFIESQNPLHIKGEPICSHDELMANFFAQPDALAMGKPSEELRQEGCRPDLIPHRTFDGNRPSLSLLVPKVNAYHLGQILALYEHRTAVEGFMWDINSFDQWGVELGKSLATDIRDKMEKFRSPAQEAPSGLNPSTYRLMSRYLQQSETLIKKGGNINQGSKVLKNKEMD